jgi:beta-galactosidase
VDTEVANDHPAAKSIRLRHTLVNAAGTVVATAETTAALAPGERRQLAASLKVNSPALWHPEHPHLHTLRSEVIDANRVADTRETRIGIRRLAFTPDGLRINGERYFPMGYNRHQDHPYVGYALPDSQQYRDVKKLRDAGFTAYRCHYPPSPAFMDACDELGVLCIVASPGWQFWNPDPIFLERCIRNTREMVRRDRNRPSVILWEPDLNETPMPAEVIRTLHQAVHEEFPGDQCFTGGEQGYCDVDYARETKSGRPVLTREWGDSVDDWTSQQGRVRVARGWGELPLLTQAQNHAFKLNAIYEKNGAHDQCALNGIWLWAGIDAYRGYHQQPFLGGVLDLFRIPKFSYHFFRSQRPARPLPLPSGVESGPMVFIANYATPWSPTDVMVFSNCEEVRFSEGDRVIATQKPDPGYLLKHPPFTFCAGGAGTDKDTWFMNVEAGYHFKPAEYKAEGLIGGKVVATHTVKAPMVMTDIRLEPDLEGRPLVADGSDFIRVHAHITDKLGTTHPMANDLVTFSVEGAATLINEASFGANPVAAEAGIATALVRASAHPGKITVRATAPGLKSAEVVLESAPALGKSLH